MKEDEGDKIRMKNVPIIISLIPLYLLIPFLIFSP
jgi:hypothetical protein